MRKIYIIRPEIEIEYIKPIGRLYMALNYWRLVKIGQYQICGNRKIMKKDYKMYYIVFPKITERR